MSGTLYVIGTPIGNLDDITLRQLDTLKSVDFICAEDTRVTLKLLTRFEIKKQLISYHDHSTRAVAEGIISRLLDGENGGVVTDAGMPCISDPGEKLVRMCYENNIDVKVVPGPSAAISALAISGLNTSRFTFEGFLSVTKKQRYEHLESLRNETRTMIFYEAPHKLIYTLKDMLEYFGDRKISLCRELTKIYEEVVRLTLSEAIDYYTERNPKGEFVLVVDGKNSSDDENKMTFENALDRVAELVSSGMKTSEACKTAAKEGGLKKSELYSAFCSQSEC